MASLTSTPRLGNTGISGLLRSANTLANELNTFKDAQAAQDYAVSAKTADDYAKYEAYLRGRIDSLSSSGSVTDATKAVSLQNTLRGAFTANVSSDIQRENIQVMSGNATLQDKYNTVVSQFSRAYGVGDMALAQSLESQAYSISQSIQYQAQTAADSAASYTKAANSAKAGGENAVATSLENALGQLNTDIKAGGQGKFLSTLNSWLKTNTNVLDALGVSIDPSAKNADATAKYFSIVNAVGAAKLQAYQLAYNALLPTDPTAAQGYLDKANNLVNGKDTLPTLAGNMARDAIQQAVNTPAQFVYNNSTGKLEKSQQSGVAYDYKTGTTVPVYSGQVTAVPVQEGVNNSVLNNGVKVLPINMVNDLNKLGLQYNPAQNGDGGTIQATNGNSKTKTPATPDWLKAVLGSNGVADVYAGPNGTIQFAGDTPNGKALYTLGKDTSGKYGLFASDNLGDRLVGGDYGYNPNSGQPKGTNGFNTYGKTGTHLLPNGKTDQLAGIFQNAGNLLANAGIAQSQQAIADANDKAAQAMLTFKAPPLPTIQLAPQVAPAPVTMSAPSAPQTTSVSQATPIASPAKSPQSPGSFNLQGGGGIRLQ